MEEKPNASEVYKVSLKTQLDKVRECVVSPEQVGDDVDAFLKYYVAISKSDSVIFENRAAFTEKFKLFVMENVDASKYEMWGYERAIDSRCAEAGIIGDVVSVDR